MTFRWATLEMMAIAVELWSVQRYGLEWVDVIVLVGETFMSLQIDGGVVVIGGKESRGRGSLEMEDYEDGR